MRSEDRAGGNAGLEAVEFGDGKGTRSDRQRAQDDGRVRPQRRHRKDVKGEERRDGRLQDRASV